MPNKTEKETDEDAVSEMNSRKQAAGGQAALDEAKRAARLSGLKDEYFNADVEINDLLDEINELKTAKKEILKSAKPLLFGKKSKATPKEVAQALGRQHNDAHYYSEDMRSMDAKETKESKEESKKDEEESEEDE